MTSFTARALQTVQPDDGYHAVGGLPVPVSVHSVDEACRFLDEMCADILKPAEKLDVDALPPDEVVGYATTYRLSLDDFVGQVNAMQYRPSRWQRFVHGRKRGTIRKKLEALVEALSPVETFKAAFLPVIEIVTSPGDTTFPVAPDGDKTSPSSGEIAANLPEKKPFIHDVFVRDYLANHLADAVTRELHKKRVYEQLDYPAMVSDMVSQPERKLKFRWAVSATLAAIAITTAIAAPTYIGLHARAAEHRKREVAALLETVHKDHLAAEGTQYVQHFNRLLERVREFKAKYWFSTPVTANFYLCYKRMYKDTPGVPDLERLTDLQPCIAEFKQRIGGRNNIALERVVREYLDNFVGFSSLAMQEVDALRQMEGQLEQRYARQLAMLQRQEKKKGYALTNVRTAVLAGKTQFGRERDALRLRFAVETAPVLFYGDVLSEIAYQRSASRGSAPSRSLARLRSDISDLGAIIMNDYLVEESIASVKPLPFWQSGGIFDRGTTMIERMHAIAGRGGGRP